MTNNNCIKIQNVRYCEVVKPEMDDGNKLTEGLFFIAALAIVLTIVCLLCREKKSWRE